MLSHLGDEFRLWRLGFSNFDRDIRLVITVVQKITRSATVTCLNTLELLGMHSRPSDIYRLSKCAESLKIVEAKPCQHNPVNEKSFNGIIYGRLVRMIWSRPVLEYQSQQTG